MFRIKSWLIPAVVCPLSFAVYSRISVIGRETKNIPEIFSGVHGFTRKTKFLSNQVSVLSLSLVAVCPLVFLLDIFRVAPNLSERLEECST